jgi:hypothetical protein
MRFLSTPALKWTAVYGLLAISHALPSSLRLEDNENRSIDRRVLTPPKLGGKPVPGHPDAPVNGPDGPPVRTNPLDPATGPANSPDTPRLGTGTTQSKKPDDFSDFDNKYNKYTPDIYPIDTPELKKMFQKTPSAADWYEANGVPVGTAAKDGPQLTGIDIYGKKPVNLDDPEIEAAWTGTVDPSSNAVMTRSGEYRKGKAGSIDSEDRYVDIPESERIFISDMIARQWKDNGGNQPMKKNVSTALDISPDRLYSEPRVPNLTNHTSRIRWLLVSSTQRRRLF